MPPYLPFPQQSLEQLHAELAHWQAAPPERPSRDRYMRVCREWIARREKEAANAR
jgi:hypothetical protein